jgi:hypothetical protein
MAESFETQLARVDGKIQRIHMDDHQHRMENGLNYYLNRANDLRRSVEILMVGGAPRGTSSMLAGMALEVLLKGIARGLDRPAKPIHNLNDLASHVGIGVTQDERVILDAMSEHIYWAGRYPAPRKAEDWQRVWRLRGEQIRSSGKLSEMEIAERAITIGSFRRLWKKFAGNFERVRQSRPESAAFAWEGASPEN